MRNYLWASVTAALLVTPTMSRSFEVFTTAWHQKPLGSCRVENLCDGQYGVDDPPRQSCAGGMRITGGGGGDMDLREPGQIHISADDIARCLRIPESAITIYIQDATKDTWAAQEWMGIIIWVDTPDYKRYDFIIGIAPRTLAPRTYMHLQ
jgi:hypothetical protein